MLKLKKKNYYFLFQNFVQDELVRVQPGFKSELLTSVETFHKDAGEFSSAYDTVRFLFPLCKDTSKLCDVLIILNKTGIH